VQGLGFIDTTQITMMTVPEIIGYIAAILTTASFLPQAVLTIKTKNTESLSLSMYASFTLGVFLWLVYGWYLRDKAIIAANAITFVLASVILYVKVSNTFRKKKLPGRSGSGRYLR
jgi:MtN3 and saliva related transmembrane protein